TLAQHVSRYADHCSPRRGRRPHSQLLSQWTLPGPVQACQFLIHDDHLAAGLGVVRIEATAGTERYVQSAEIVRTGDDVVCVWDLPGRWIWSLPGKEGLPGPVVELPPPRAANGLDTGQILDLGNHSLPKLNPRL